MDRWRTTQARYRKSQKGKQTLAAWKKTEIGRACSARNDKYPAAKERHRRYLRTLNGRAKRLSTTRMYQTRKKNARQGNRAALHKIYTRCQELRKWFDVEVDHIIPLSAGGSHAPRNLQIIYASENRRKRCHLGYKPKIIFK